MKDRTPHEHPLFLAIPSGNTQLVVYLLENCPFQLDQIVQKYGKIRGIGISERYSQNDPFILACQYSVTDICEEFFKTGIFRMPAPTKADVRLGIITAIEHKQTNMMIYLLEHKKYRLKDNIEIISKHAWNTGVKCGILALAVRSGCEGMVKYLVDIGATLSLEELIVSVFETKVWNNRNDLNLMNIVYIIQQNNLINSPVPLQGNPEWGLNNNCIHFQRPKLSPHFIAYLLTNGYGFLDNPELSHEEDDPDWSRVYQMLWDSIHNVDTLKSLCRNRIRGILGCSIGGKVETLPVPTYIKNYLLRKEIEHDYMCILDE